VNLSGIESSRQHSAKFGIRFGDDGKIFRFGRMSWSLLQPISTRCWECNTVHENQDNYTATRGILLFTYTLLTGNRQQMSIANNPNKLLCTINNNRLAKK